MRETWVRSLGWEDPLEKGKATHSNILAWGISWMVWSVGSQRPILWCFLTAAKGDQGTLQQRIQWDPKINPRVRNQEWMSRWLSLASRTHQRLGMQSWSLGQPHVAQLFLPDFFFFSSLGLCWCTQAFSSGGGRGLCSNDGGRGLCSSDGGRGDGGRGLLSSGGAQAVHCSGFPCCGAPALGPSGFSNCYLYQIFNKNVIFHGMRRGGEQPSCLFQ